MGAIRIIKTPQVLLFDPGKVDQCRYLVALSQREMELVTGALYSALDDFILIEDRDEADKKTLTRIADMIKESLEVAHE